MSWALPGIVGDILTCVSFSTRLPLAPRSISGPELARASWALPVAGAVVGGFGALLYWLASLATLPPLAAAALAVAGTAVLTGCLHEDGLADVADAFGGANPASRLAIMRDSRIGSYGACALTLSLLLRSAALAGLPEVARAASALIASHVAARASLPWFMRALPAARTEGLSATAGNVPIGNAVTAAGLGTLALVLGLGIKPTLLALALMVASVALGRWFCLRRFGGHTGDVLGALEQIGEIMLLLIAAAA